MSDPQDAPGREVPSNLAESIEGPGADAPSPDERPEPPERPEARALAKILAQNPGG